MINADDYIFVGKLGKSVGLKGYVNLISLTSFPERFDGMDSFFLTKERKVPLNLKVEDLLENNGRLSVKFCGIDSIAEAEKLMGYRVTIKKEDRFELPENYYYVDDLKECTCYTTAGKALGKIKEVLDNAANDIYIIDYNGKDLLVPVIDKFVKEIDLENKRIVVELIKGMLPDEN